MYILSNFSESLGELLILHDLTEKSLSEKTGIPVACISLYLRRMQVPYIKALVKLADFFHCSVDYLIGLSDDDTEVMPSELPPFAAQLEKLMADCQMPPTKIYACKEISKSSFYEWKRGKSLPTLESLVALAQIFHCSVDDVLVRKH